VSEEPEKLEVTEVDEALRVARANPAQGGFFYDAFLNADIYIPALRADKRPGDWAQLKSTERFFPLYLRQGEARAVPVFDRLERLKAWAQDRAFDYLVLQAHLFLRVIAPEVQILLNEGTQSTYLFTVEILDALRKAARPVQPS